MMILVSIDLNHTSIDPQNVNGFTDVAILYCWLNILGYYLFVLLLGHLGPVLFALACICTAIINHLLHIQWVAVDEHFL